jgi:nitrate reductase gamma subunit
MLVRRAFFYWQFAAVAVLPSWILVGWALWGHAGDFVGIAIAAPFLVLALLGVAGLTYARKSVREVRAVSWIDVAVAGVWHVLVIATGLFTPATSALAALSIAAGIAAFWAVSWQLIAETRRRVRRVFQIMEQGAAPTAGKQAPIEAGEYFVIRPSDSPR